MVAFKKLSLNSRIYNFFMFKVHVLGATTDSSMSTEGKRQSTDLDFLKNRLFTEQNYISKLDSDWIICKQSDWLKYYKLANQQ